MRSRCPERHRARRAQGARPVGSVVRSEIRRKIVSEENTPNTEAEAPAPASTPAPATPARPAASSERPARSSERSSRQRSSGDRPRSRYGGNRRGRGRGRKVTGCTSRCVGRQNTKIDYKQVQFLQRYVTDRGKIRPRRQTGNCAKHQRVLARAIKRARYMAFLPYTADHSFTMDRRRPDRRERRDRR